MRKVVPYHLPDTNLGKIAKGDLTLKEIRVIKKTYSGIIYTEKEYIILVDDWRYDEISKNNWSIVVAATGAAYPKTRVSGNRKTVYMANFIVGTPIPPYCTDHINGNTLDNQEHNLSIVTVRQNQQNRHVTLNRLPGVFDAANNKTNPYESKIHVGNRRYRYLGQFKTKIEAFFAYKDAVYELGESFTPWVLEKCYRIIDSEMVHI